LSAPAAVGKIAWEVKERHYDLVVVDASATGHVVGQLAAPEAINELVQVGRIRDQTRWMLDLLSDPVITGTVVVERIFALPGVGNYFINASLNRDEPLIIGIVAFISVAVLVFNMLADVAYALLDPRIRT